jgi:hypothetical protein
MVRTQIYLTERERDGLVNLARILPGFSMKTVCLIAGSLRGPKTAAENDCQTPALPRYGHVFRLTGLVACSTVSSTRRSPSGRLHFPLLHVHSDGIPNGERQR